MVHFGLSKPQRDSKQAFFVISSSNQVIFFVTAQVPTVIFANVLVISHHRLVEHSWFKFRISCGTCNSKQRRHNSNEWFANRSKIFDFLIPVKFTGQVGQGQMFE